MKRDTLVLLKSLSFCIELLLKRNVLCCFSSRAFSAFFFFFWCSVVGVFFCFVLFLWIWMLVSLVGFFLSVSVFLGDFLKDL